MGGDAPKDEDLLRRFLNGDVDAFGELIRRHEDRIFALALRMTGDRSDALEATQETFISALRRAESFRGDAAFSTWLYRIAINSTKDLLRRRRRRPEADEQPERPAGGNLEETVVSRVDLADAFRRLPDDYREAVLLHDLGGVPYEEIARITGSKVGTVKSRISRGRRMLAGFLEQPRREQTSKE